MPYPSLWSCVAARVCLLGSCIANRLRLRKTKRNFEGNKTQRQFMTTSGRMSKTTTSGGEANGLLNRQHIINTFIANTSPILRWNYFTPIRLERRNVGFFLLKWTLRSFDVGNWTKKSAMKKKDWLFSKEANIHDFVDKLCWFAVLHDVVFRAQCWHAV